MTTPVRARSTRVAVLSPGLVVLALLVLALLVVGARPAAAQYGGTQGFVIDPPVVETGGTVSFLGTGCAGAGSVVFTIEPLGITLGETTPEPSGDFFLPGVVLNLDPGVYPVTATCGDVVLVAQVTVLAAGAGLIDTDGDGIPDSVAFTGASTLVVKLGLTALALGLFFVVATRRRDDEPEPAPA